MKAMPFGTLDSPSQPADTRPEPQPADTVTSGDSARVTRRQASARINAAIGSLRGAVLTFLAAAGSRGATDEEIARGLELRESTCRARRVELRDAGQVIDSGRTRSTTSRRAAVALTEVDRREATRAVRERLRQDINAAQRKRGWPWPKRCCCQEAGCVR